MEQIITTKTKEMIDSLKAVCTNFGLGNAASEYKIMTEVFLYKFLNDKFLAETKIVKPEFKDMKSADVEKALMEMSDDDYELLLLDFGANIATLKREHLISYLYNRQNTKGFHKLFDNTLKDISATNADIFSVRTGSESKMNLFSGISQHVLEEEKRDDFCRAIIDKIGGGRSFEEVFKQKYDFFAQIFEYLIKDYNKDFGKYAEYYTPHSIASIIAQIMAPDGDTNVSVYDPAAGSGTLVLALAHQIGENNCTIYTQDISQKSNEFLRLNLILNNLIHSLPNIIHGDTLVSPFHKNDTKTALKKFHYIVSNPPFNVDFSETRNVLAGDDHKNRFWAGVPNIPKKDKKSMQIYLMFLQHIINSLEVGGKAAIVVPTPFLTKGKGIDLKIRKRLIDKKILRGVISMPNNIFSTTGTNVSVLLIENISKDEEVIFIDASKLGSKNEEVERNQKTVLSPTEQKIIVDTYLNQIETKDFSVKVTFDKIKNREYRLSPSSFFTYNLEYSPIEKETFDTNLIQKLNNVKLYFSNELESLLDDIFNYWFVQFEFPYKQSTYKNSGGVFEFNEKLEIEIPKGWQVKNIQDGICKIVDCLHSKKPTEKFESEIYYLLQLENLTPEGRVDISKKYFISHDDYKTWSSRIEINEGDFIVTNAGRAGAIGVVPEGIKCAIGRNMTAIRPIGLPPSFLRLFLRSPYMKKYLASNLDEGSFFKSFNVKSIKKIDILVPDNDTLSAFIKIIQPITNMILNGIKPQKEIKEIKDLLASSI